MKDITQLLAWWQEKTDLGQNFECVKALSEKTGEFSPFPSTLHTALTDILIARGIKQLYSHQARSFELVNMGKNIVVCTGTASGKTWCYNLPVLNSLLSNNAGKALYLFPTKALAQDQLVNLETICVQINKKYDRTIKPHIYDGDTPSSRRSQIRDSGSIVLTNPDMLHIGILPHHVRRSGFFTALKFIVIDEIHTYRGIFGTHVANLIRRLRRVTAFYGAYPQFILTSATIGNPSELATQLIELPVDLIDQDGAPRGKRNFAFYNPPIVRQDIGLRKSAASEAELLISDLVKQQFQTIMFCRTRRMVELMIRQLQHKFPKNSGIVRGYRSGYLSEERREIEQGLRTGNTLVVATTNALELGIDIGNLDCAILYGYPGSISATIQQAGRAGRRNSASLAIFLATNSPTDQFLIRHPEYLLEQSPEVALIDANNLLILLQHLKCAAFELPFHKGTAFGCVPPALLDGLLEILANENVLHRSDNSYYWAADQYPASHISLRSTLNSPVLIERVADGKRNIIGQVDRPSAVWMVHPQAVYIHEGQTYQVKSLDLEKGLALVSLFNDDFYTEPKTEVNIDILQIKDQRPVAGGSKYLGEVDVKSQVIGFQQIRWGTQERLAQFPLDMPIEKLRTMAFWISIAPSAVDEIRNKGLWREDKIYYGPNWENQRALTRQRDNFTCQVCGQIEGRVSHHVHHKIPFRQIQSYQIANQLENLITLCPACHQRVETSVRMRTGLAGTSYILQHLAPLFLMCDSGDLGVFIDPQASQADGSPMIMIFENVSGGVGLSPALYNLHSTILSNALEQVEKCRCVDGCPACIGASGENGIGGKKETIALLQVMNGVEIHYG